MPVPSHYDALGLKRSSRGYRRGAGPPPYRTEHLNRRDARQERVRDLSGPPVTTTVISSSLRVRLSVRKIIRTAVHGLDLDLDQDPLVDEVDLHDRHRWPDVAEHLSWTTATFWMSSRFARRPRHDHVGERAAQIIERSLHRLDGRAHLLDERCRTRRCRRRRASGPSDANLIADRIARRSRNGTRRGSRSCTVDA